MGKPRVLVLADVPEWAWGRKGRAYAQHLSDRFAVTLAFQRDGAPAFRDFDLVHLFEVSQVHAYAQPLFEDGGPGGRPYRVVAGLTAHVWPTWGAERMRFWADQVDALHGNSALLAAELKQFHPRVYYTPNGVDAAYWRRLSPRPVPGRVVFGHVGKPNLRKGGDVIIEAARLAPVELRSVRRISRLALSQADMLAWYQGIDVMVCASNMDGTPNPMLEGAACECALLSTPIGNMPEFIEEDSMAVGYLLDNRLPMATTSEEDRRKGVLPQEAVTPLKLELAAVMSDMANQPKLVRTWGEQARVRVLTGWTWEHQVAHVAAMWEEVLG